MVDLTNHPYRKYPVNDSFLDEIGDEQAWFLGLMASDGYVRDDGVIGITQSGHSGHKLIESVQAMIDHSGPIYLSKKVQAHTISFTSRRIRERLLEFGIGPRKSLTLEYPSALPRERDAAFIRGYLEGDGCTGIYKNNVGTPIIMISWVGTESFIRESASRVPVPMRIHHIKRAKNCYELRVTGQKAISLDEWLWSNPDLPITRKKLDIQGLLNTYQPAYVKYAPLRKQAVELLHQGMPAMQVAKVVGVPFQTIYKWREKL